MNQSSNSRPLGVGVVGLGMGAKPHARALRDLSESLTVRGAFARTSSTRDAFCKEYGFQAADSIERIMDDPDIDFVMLLTPPNARLEHIKACAAAGKHVLMEKPVERTVAAAQEIVKTCEDAGIKLGVVFQHRFRKGSVKLAELLTSGAVGEIACVRLTVPWWRDQSYYDEPGRGTYDRDGGGVLISQAIHSMDLMLSLTGPVAEVQAIAATTKLHSLEAEDFVGAGLRFQNGAVGSLTATTAAFPGEPEAILIDCEKASLKLESGALTIHWRDGRVEEIPDDLASGAGADPMAFPHDWHRDLIADFASAVADDRDPVITGREALNVHYLIDALIKSSRQGRTVAVKS